MKTTTPSPLSGLDDPRFNWLQQVVRVKDHPEWGMARVVRWFPAQGQLPERLRIMAENVTAPQLVLVSQVELGSE